MSEVESKHPFTRTQEKFIEQRILDLTKPWYRSTGNVALVMLAVVSMVGSRFADSPVLTNFLHEVLLTDKAVVGSLRRTDSELSKQVNFMLDGRVRAATQGILARPITAYHWRGELGSRFEAVANQQCARLTQPSEVIDLNPLAEPECFREIALGALRVNFFANRGDRVTLHLEILEQAFSVARDEIDAGTSIPSQDTLDLVSIKLEGKCVHERGCTTGLVANRSHHILPIGNEIDRSGLHQLELDVRTSLDSNSRESVSIAPNTLLVAVVILVENRDSPGESRS